VDVEGFVVC